MSRSCLALACLLAIGILPKAYAENPMDKTVTFSVPKITIEQALQRVSEQTGLKIEIQLDELRKEGISKNQSFEIELRDATARQALKAILLKGDRKGRLVYFIKGDGVIIVTTSNAVKTAEYAGLFVVSYDCLYAS